MKYNDWIHFAGIVTTFLLGIYIVITKHLLTRDGTPLSENAAICFGIILIAVSLYFYQHSDGQGEKDKTEMKCPFCGKRKAGWTPGKYKCKNCGKKFIIEPERSD